MQIPAFSNAKTSLDHGIQDEGFEGHFRLEAANDALASLSTISFHDSRPISDEELYLAHSREHQKLIIEQAKKSGPDGIVIGEQIRIYPGSWNACSSMAGGCIQGIEMMIAHKLPYAWVIGRSPGHHAEDMFPMGYCLLSNVAIAAMVAHQKFGLRVAIIDFDVHQGNGTRKILANLSQFLVADIFINGHNEYPTLAQFNHKADNIIEVPLPPGTTYDSYSKVVSSQILPKISTFAPDLLICSAGFDCMKDDPFGGFQLSAIDMRRLTSKILDLNVPSLFVLEGGYNIPNLANGITGVTEAIKKKLSMKKIQLIPIQDRN